MESVLATNITEEQIYKEFLRLGMEQLIAKNLQKDIANLDAKIDNVEKNLKQNLDEKLKINNQFLLEKIEINNQFLLEKIEINNQLLSKNLDSSNRFITIMSIILVPIAIAIIGPFVLSLINGFFKQ